MSNKHLIDFLEMNRPDNIDVDVVWQYLIILVRDEKLSFHRLKEIYLEYIIYKMFGSQGVWFISEYDGNIRASIGGDAETCSEKAFLKHLQKVINLYMKEYGEGEAITQWRREWQNPLRIYTFFNKHHPLDPDVKNVWQYLIIALRDDAEWERLVNIQTLKWFHEYYLDHKIMSISNIAFEARQNGKIRVRRRKDYECDEQKFFDHYHKVINLYMQRYPIK
ncbi:hypothetical protein JQC72_06605 [Polycladomyces sp. WAk]|uniref:LAGLIDADG endonuclease n=1 Tax=Polycladomyces zharkentensis TaxID=2807616 RepID=A0ABS2WI33_9BACL|nr:hypothetical protein [Polycladomyces sp. WAk]MBN2909192.1 hypothetical protein [Polycladomyces sp. WAk]